MKNNTTKVLIKSQVSETAFNLAKKSRLTESYNEKTRRSQHYEADLTQYNEKQRATIQKAIDSGILNNSNRTHEFVDLLANISADKGVLFDFINNERLKNSSFAVKGKTVNGYKTDDGNVALNIDSSKSLNSVVGHEITHVLEGTELYSTLQEAAKQYAEAKGEYATRMQSLRELYTGVYKGKDFDARLQEELTADIIGDYLFTDSDFVNNLSTEQPGLFKKIYNEIKYLCKVATAGSNEARALEKVKKTFEDAWRQNGTAQKNTTDEGGVKYSISESVTDTEGNQYNNVVKVNTDIFKGYKPRNWKTPLKKFVDNNLIGEKITLFNEEGKSKTIEFAKANDRIVNESGNKRKVIDKLKQKNDRNSQIAVANIKNLVEVSFEDSSVPHSEENRHQWLDTKGWDYRFAYMEMSNGKLYSVQLNIANTADGRYILYDINKISELGIDSMLADEKSTASQNSKFAENSVPQNSKKSIENINFSLSDSNSSSKDVYGFSVNKNAKVNEDLLEELSIYHPDAQVDSDGNVTVYHRTSKENADKIRKTGVMTALEDALFFSSKSEGYASDYGDTVLAFKIPSTVLRVIDIFDGEVHFDIPLKRINNQWSLNVSKYLTDENTQYSLSDSHKEKQLDIINKYHPKADWDYQTWITSVDDIKTYAETVEDESNYATTPDFTDDDVAKALKTGKVMVYSSHDIRKGTFVTPSYMEAKNYAGGGKVNSMMVNLTDVAWIDSLQGQYAPVEAVPKQSLSAEVSQATEHGTYNVHGADIAYTEDIGPVRDDIPIVKKRADATAEFIGGPVREDISKAPQKKSVDVAHSGDVEGSVRDDLPVKPQASLDDVPANNTSPDEEPVSITTVKERLEAKLSNATAELENNKQLREESINRFNKKIADYQAKYEAKKNKDTKVANDILRSIERLKTSRDNNTADFDKRINDIEKRIGKITEQLQQDHTKEDNLERSLKRIDARLEREKAALIEEFNSKKAETFVIPYNLKNSPQNL